MSHDTPDLDINLDELSTQSIAAKVGLRSLTLTRIEGPVELCSSAIVFTSDERGTAWAHLRWYLNDQRYTFPAYGRHRCALFIEFNDGYRFEHRLECGMNDTFDLPFELRDALMLRAGLRTPDKVAQSRYLKTLDANDMVVARHLLDTYDLRS